jgi:hypothetical protein
LTKNCYSTQLKILFCKKSYMKKIKSTKKGAKECSGLIELGHPAPLQLSVANTWFTTEI